MRSFTRLERESVSIRRPLHTIYNNKSVKGRVANCEKVARNAKNLEKIKKVKKKLKNFQKTFQKCLTLFLTDGIMFRLSIVRAIYDGMRL